MKNYSKIHRSNISKAQAAIREAYLKAIEEMTKLAVSVIAPSHPFKFSDYPWIKSRLDSILATLAKEVKVITVNGAKAADKLANDRFTATLKDIYKRGNGDKILNAEEATRWFTSIATEKATMKFLDRKVKGLNLSDRVWKNTELLKTNVELALERGIQEGKSAAELSREVRDALNQPNKIFRRTRNPDTGKLELSKAAKEFHPGQGVYRSSYKNALRLTGTETNIAYRSAFNTRVREKKWITGIEIRLSNNHTCKDGKGGLIPNWKDICDELAGVYRKDFVWTGWHPACFDSQSEVLTRKGWKFFRDVSVDEDIFSLNPDTRSPEWVKCVLTMHREYEGNMFHFFNRNLDCLVTPEHEMVYLNKTDGGIKRCTAEEYRKGKGAFYRGAEWEKPETRTIKIGDQILDFSLFCQFMGYWLSDGSTNGNRRVVIAQQDDDPNKQKIVSCIKGLGFDPRLSFNGVAFSCKDLCEYLKQFGTAYFKFIPDCVKNAAKSEIQRFLDAFISCDGHVKKARPFVGNRGTMCVPKNDERVYFTSSPQLASDIGELIIKIGKRPSYRLDRCAGRLQRFKNGIYTINHDLHIISECHATTATVFDKKKVGYSGMVYDITLDRNHIMYVRRNGRCFWGSNCRCEQIIVHQDPVQAIREFKKGISTAKQIENNPPQFEKWKEKNSDNIEKWKDKGTLPYFLKDNPQVIE